MKNDQVIEMLGTSCLMGAKYVGATPPTLRQGIVAKTQKPYKFVIITHTVLCGGNAAAIVEEIHRDKDVQDIKLAVIPMGADVVVEVSKMEMDSGVRRVTGIVHPWNRVPPPPVSGGK